MANKSISLGDKFNLQKSNVLLNGTQGLVRLMLGQKQRDEKLGLNTAGFVTGYRGSPLGAVDFQMKRAAKELKASKIEFKEALNEDLATTSLWGAQQAELRGEGIYDGVFGLWYGKGPGVDRSGDAMRHANMAGSSKNGGVLMAMGDDHTGESSTVLHQSDLAMIDAGMPILSPAGVQEILDYGYYGFALSRHSGLWVGLKTMKDTIEVTSVVDGDPFRMDFKSPKSRSGAENLNIRLVDTPADQEKRLFNDKKILLVSVPGAFTPTCSEQHLPGYIKHKDDIISKGIDKIYFVSVNDPFVMQEWAKTFKENDIGFIADSYGDLLNEIEAIIELTVMGLGKRLSRFSMIIDNGLVNAIFDEEGGGLDKSKAENVLKFL